VRCEEFGETVSFGGGFLGPGSGDDVVHFRREDGEGGGTSGGFGFLSVVGEEVEDDGGELGGSSSLGEEDGVGGGDGEEGSDTGWREGKE